MTDSTNNSTGGNDSTNGTGQDLGAKANQSGTSAAAGTADGPQLAQAQDGGQVAADVVILSAPQPGERVTVEAQPGQDLRLTFDPAMADGAETGGDVVLTFPNGGEIVLDGFAEAALSGNPPELTTADGTAINLAEFLVALGVSPESIEAAAGEPAGPLPGVPNEGASFTPGEAPEILGSLDPSGPLGPTALNYTTPEIEGGFRLVGDGDEDDGEPQGPVDGAPDAVDDGTGTGNLPQNDNEAFGGETHVVEATSFEVVGTVLQSTFLENAVSGNVLANDAFGPDGRGGIVGIGYGGDPADVIVEDSGASTVRIFAVDGSWTLDFNTETGAYSFDLSGPYQHAPGSDEAIESFTYTIADADGDTSSAVLRISITDDGPRAVNDSASLSEGAVISGDVLFNDDRGADGATVTSVNGISVTPDLGGHGVIVTSPSVPVTPDLGDQGVITTLGSGSTIIPGAYGTLEINPDGTYWYTANQSVTGQKTDRFEYTITDADGDTSTATLTITVGDANAPTASRDTDSVVEGRSVESTILDSVVFGGDGEGNPKVTNAGTYTGTHGTLTLNEDGSYTYAANPGLDHSDGPLTDSFTYTIQDGDGTAASSTLTITITDDGPTADADTDRVEEGQAITGTVIDTGDAFGSDGQGTPVVTNAGTHGGTYGSLVLNADGTYTYTADPSLHHTGGAPLTDTFNYTIQDGDGTTSTSTLTITITDDGPVADADTNTVEEGQSVRGNVVDSGDDFGSDGTGTPIVDNPGTHDGTYGSLVLNADGSYVYTADPDLEHSSGAPLTDTFNYTIRDEDGSTSTNTLTITITDDGPVADADIDTVKEGKSITGTVIDSGDDFGSDGQGTPVITNTGTHDGTYGSLVLNADGSYTYTADPSLDHSGGPLTDTFDYTIQDEDGTTSTNTLTITITDDGPVADADTDRVEEGSSTTGTVIDTGDAFGSDGQGTPVVTNAGTHNGTHGTLVLNADGTYTYTADPGLDHSGGAPLTDTFDYTIQDDDGTTSTSTLTITITDDEPMAADDTASVDEGVTLTGLNVLDNDTQGSDGATVTGVSFGAAGGTVGTPLAGAYGMLTLNADGSYSYAANDSVIGTHDDVFTYTITDGDGDIATATLTITVGDANEPVANIDHGSVNEAEGHPGPDGPFQSVTTVGNLITNDSDGGDGFAATAITGVTYDGALGAATQTAAAGTITFTASNWTLEINQQTGAYTFTQTAPFDHPDGNGTNLSPEGAFTYTIADADGSTDSSTLTITITDDVPTAQNDLASVFEGGTVTGGILGNDDTGADGLGSLSVDGGAITGDSTEIDGDFGTLTINKDGSYSYKADDNVSGEQTDEFHYTITDKDGDTDTVTLTININDSTPVAGDDSAHVFSGQQKAFNLVYVMDVSNSMNELIEGGGTRLDAAKAAFTALNNQAIAAGLEGAQVLVVAFSDGVQQVHEFTLGTDNMDIAAFINGLTASGNTKYETALDVVTDWLDGRAISDISGSETTSVEVRHGADADSRVFFLTDGGNNNGNGGFDPESHDIGSLYGNAGDLGHDLVNVTVKTVGFGITEGDTAFYNSVDQADDNLLNGSAVAVPDAAGAEGVEAGFGTIETQTTVSGNLLDNDSSADGVMTITSITVDGTTYDATDATDGNLTDLNTTLGGKFSFDFDTGTYTYEAPTDIFSSGMETIGYTIQDGDGDTASAALTIEIDPGLLPNGGFEAGNLLDWETVGSAWVSGGADSSGTGLAQEGDYLAVLHTNHPVDRTFDDAPLTPSPDYEHLGYRDGDIEDFLGLGHGTLDSLISESARQGTVLKTVVTVADGAEGTITFDWNFLTNQFGTNDEGDQTDFAFAVVDGEVHLLANSDNEGATGTQQVLDIDDVLVDGQNFSHGTDWQNASFAFSDTNGDGKIEIAFGVMDGSDINRAAGFDQNSALMVDDVQVQIATSTT